MRCPLVSNTDELLAVTLPSLAAVVSVCRLPSIQEPHSSQDKQTQSLQLSSAIRGTGHWQIKRGEMKCFFVSLQVVRALKVLCVHPKPEFVNTHVRTGAQLHWWKNSLMAVDRLQLQCFCCFVSQEQMNTG